MATGTLSNGTIINNGKTYAESNGTQHAFLGVWDPNTIYTAGSTGANNQSSKDVGVVEYSGGIYQANYYTVGVNPLTSFETPGTVAGANWIVLSAPSSANVTPNAPYSPYSTFVTASSISLAWPQALVLGAGNVSSYQVFESTSANFSNVTMVGTTTTPSININGLAANTTYYFKVKAVDASGVSDYSTISSAVATTLMNPTSGKFFSPFVDLTQPSEIITNDAAAAGLRDFTVAFLNSAGLQSPTLSSGSTATSGTSVTTPNYGMYNNDGSVPSVSLGGATIEPNGAPVLNEGGIYGQVKQIANEGGSITVAIGGYTGRDPAIIAAEYGAYLAGTPYQYNETYNGNGTSSITTASGSAAAVGSSAYNQAVANLQAEFQSAVSSTGASTISFDIENDTVFNQQWQYNGYWKEVTATDAKGSTAFQADILNNSALAQAANAMRNQAIIGLEQANPNLQVSFTLAALPTGLANGSNMGTSAGGANGGVTAGDNAQALLLAAKAAGVRIDTVNIMAMDYGTTTDASGNSYDDSTAKAPGSTVAGSATNMAIAAEQAALATEAFLVANGMASTKVEITPMLGQNDTPGEVFTLNDAVALEAWAASRPWVAGIGEWSLNRDHKSPAGQPANSTGSGLSQTDFQLSDALAIIANATTVATMNANLTSLNTLANGFAIGDTEKNIVNGIASLQSEASHIVSVNTTDGVPVSVGIGKFTAAQQVLDKVAGGFAIVGTASAIQNNIAGLQADVANITSIAAVDGVISVGVGKFTPNQAALNKITAGFSIVGQSSVISSNFDSLAADSSHINTLSFADPNPVLALTAAQTVNDAALLAKVSGNYVTQIANTDGSTTITGHGAGLVINATASGGNTITGGGPGTTFVFKPSFGTDTVTDFASYLSGSTHDTIALPQSEFASFADVLNNATYSASATTITSPTNADKLVLQGVTASQLQGSSADFKFG